MPRRTLSAYLRQIKKNIWAKNMHAVQIWQLYTAIYIFWLIQSLLFLFATLKHFLQLLFVSLFITLPFRKFLERNTFFYRNFNHCNNSSTEISATRHFQPKFLSMYFFNWNFININFWRNISSMSIFFHCLTFSLLYFFGKRMYFYCIILYEYFFKASFLQLPHFFYNLLLQQPFFLNYKI